MFSTEECIEILNHDTLVLSEGVIVNCNMNTLEIASRDIIINLNESQKRLLICLTKKICAKRDIINIVWHENHQRISDNNYHQLAFQIRALFSRNNLPDNLLVTVPYYGLKLNEDQWKVLSAKNTVTPIASENKNIPHVSEKDHQKQENVIIVNAQNSMYGEENNTAKMARHPRLPQISILQHAFILCVLAAVIAFL